MQTGKHGIERIKTCSSSWFMLVSTACTSHQPPIFEKNYEKPTHIKFLTVLSQKFFFLNNPKIASFKTILFVYCVSDSKKATISIERNSNSLLQQQHTLTHQNLLHATSPHINLMSSRVQGITLAYQEK